MELLNLINKPFGILICICLLVFVIALGLDSRKAYLKYKRDALEDRAENERLAQEAKELERTRNQK